MPKLLLILVLNLAALSTIAQNNTQKNTSATVNIIVTDTKQVPVKGEEVVFISSENKTFSCRSGADGRSTLNLAAGDIYTIKLKTLTDSTAYGTLEIPSLKPNQFFTSPFSVVIEFEPPKNFTLNNVEFDTGKPTLRPSSYKELNEIAEYMKWKDDENYEISGHTDNVGKDADNQKLSQQRAEAVKNYLVKKGIKASRIVAKGYGASKPVADNTTPEGRQKNRRTELLIIESENQ